VLWPLTLRRGAGLGYGLRVHAGGGHAGLGITLDRLAGVSCQVGGGPLPLSL
jgi:hypothetical protein